MGTLPAHCIAPAGPPNWLQPPAHSPAWLQPTPFTCLQLTGSGDYGSRGLMAQPPERTVGGSMAHPQPPGTPLPHHVAMAWLSRALCGSTHFWAALGCHPEPHATRRGCLLRCPGSCAHRPCTISPGCLCAHRTKAGVAGSPCEWHGAPGDSPELPESTQCCVVPCRARSQPLSVAETAWVPGDRG